MTKKGKTKVPSHVAIIMDGNGRWAQQRGKPRTDGHRKGAERVREIVKAADSLGVKVLTLFAFSTENWNRPDYEVGVLMKLFSKYVVREVDELDSANVQVRFIGERSRLPGQLQRAMAQMEERTAGNSALVLQIALSYGSRTEMLHAARTLAEGVVAGRLTPAEITEEHFSANLWTAGVPDPDLVIRTSGEQRISNFLLWQSAYAEYVFVDECWPDFTPKLFAEVVSTFAERERRYGKVS